MTTILVADDDPRIASLLQRIFAFEGYRVFTAGDGLEALEKLEAHRPDLAVLDWWMPQLDGLAVIQHLRARTALPVLMLTARDAVPNRIEALNGGADDYLIKPFALDELLARVRALLRRALPAPPPAPLSYHDVSLDLTTREVLRGARRLDLTPKEFELLRYFLRHPQQVIARRQLLLNVWGYDFGGDSAVLDVYIGYLRNKLEAGGEARLIHTLRGMGYILREA